MFFIETSQFIEEGLQNILRAREQTAAIFVTRNDVFGYRAGTVKTKQAHLQVTVHNYRSPGFHFDLIPEPEALVTGLTGAHPPHLVVFQYGGKGIDQDDISRFVRNGREKYGNGFALVILICDCFLELNRSQLKPYFDRGEIQAVVWDKRCGGQVPMGEILDVLLADM